MVQVNESQQSLDIRDSVLDYFNQEIRSKELHSICLVGCGEAGSKLAGVFRLKPDFVSAFLPGTFPVRAIAMDTQADLPERMDNFFGWHDPRVQIAFAPPPPEDIPELLGLPSAPGDEEGQAGQGYSVERTGGAGGFTLNGRASALYNFRSNADAREANLGHLNEANVLSRVYNGYLATFSGLGGGTGSGSVPVVVDWMQQVMEPAPVATFSVCIIPERDQGAGRGDPRMLGNLLTSLYYLATTSAINGIILADNLLLLQQGHRDLVTEVNRHLQDVLMPVFLSAQAAYHFAPFGTQLDPANVRLTIAPHGDASHQFIAAGFSVFPLSNAPQRIKNMRANLVAAKDSNRLPDIMDMLGKAFEATTINCDPYTSRNILALLSGPAWALERMIPDNLALLHFQDFLREICAPDAGPETDNRSRFARFFMADFPQMTDVRLTVLLCGPEFPDLEDGLRLALQDPDWAPQNGESLADAIRRIPEQLVLSRGLEHMAGIDAFPQP